MANSTQFFKPSYTHFWQVDSSAVAGMSSPTYNSNFRIKNVMAWVTTGAPGATLTLIRTRGGVNTTICAFDVSAVGPAVFTLNIDQSAALIESGDTMTMTTSSAASTLNLFVDLIQFST